MTDEEAIYKLREAIRLTREFVGEPMLPAIPGWAWYETIRATGGLDGFGGCGAVLDPDLWGHTIEGDLRYCNMAAGHRSTHGWLPTRAAVRPAGADEPGPLVPTMRLSGPEVAP